MKVRYSRPAANELAQAIAYVAEHSPQGAERVLRRIREIERHIAQYPNAGMKTRDPSLRAVLTLPYSYVLLYEEIADEILVHRVRHTSRRGLW